ncbi:hypothetical protein ACP70R_041196 [Stipagrostis hirtigluma subsp. patula]
MAMAVVASSSGRKWPPLKSASRTARSRPPWTRLSTARMWAMRRCLLDPAGHRARRLHALLPRDRTPPPDDAYTFVLAAFRELINIDALGLEDRPTVLANMFDAAMEPEAVASLREHGVDIVPVGPVFSFLDEASAAAAGGGKNDAPCRRRPTTTCSSKAARATSSGWTRRRPARCHTSRLGACR